MSKFSMIEMPSQKGKTAIVTGANIGLGYQTAKGLLAKEAHVIMASRNMEKAQRAKDALISEIPRSSIEIIQLDLADKSSIEQFAKEYEAKHDTLDLLINNAGIMIPPYRETEFGFESQWGVNFLGHFYLTGLLFPTINKTENARVVTLSSLAHKNGEIRWDDVNRKKNYKPMESYQQSKLADLIFAFELQRRLTSKGKSQKSLAAHPGVALTNLFASAPSWMRIIAPLFSWMLHSVEDGAKPTLMAAMDPTLLGGEYIGPTGRREMKGEPGIAKSTELSRNEEVGERLWKLAEEQLGFTFSI